MSAQVSTATVASAVGFLWSGVTAFIFFAHSFTRSDGDELRAVMTACVGSAGLGGAVMAAIAHRSVWRPLLFSTLPFLPLMALLVLGGMEKGFRQNGPAILAVGLMIGAFAFTALAVAWIKNRQR